MDVSLPMHHAWLSKRDHNHGEQQMGVLSLASFGHVVLDDGGTRPRHISTQGTQPHGMDVGVSLAR